MYIIVFIFTLLKLNTSLNFLPVHIPRFSEEIVFIDGLNSMWNGGFAGLNISFFAYI